MPELLLPMGELDNDGQWSEKPKRRARSASNSRKKSKRTSRSKSAKSTDNKKNTEIKVSEATEKRSSRRGNS